jgi:hypothetical protein
MPGHGPAPKETSLQQGSPMVQPGKFQVLSADGHARGPELPDRRPDGQQWSPATVDWWDVWRHAAQSQLFTPTDWTELLFAALLVDEIWTKQRGRTMAMTELRQRMAKFGAAPDDRMRLRMKIGDNDPADAKSGTTLARAVPIDRRKKPENFGS